MLESNKRKKKKPGQMNTHKKKKDIREKVYLLTDSLLKIDLVYPNPCII